MDKEELKHLTSDCEYFLNGRGEINLYNFIENLRTTYIEPKEKRIDELEDKLANADYQLEGRDNEIAELETEVNRLKLNEQLAVKNGKNLLKENAELKEKQKWLGSSTKCWFSNSPCRSCDEHDERLRRLGLCYIGQLTKATGIIKDMLSILPKENIEGIYEITEEAEQFLNEVEK